VIQTKDAKGGANNSFCRFTFVFVDSNRMSRGVVTNNGGHIQAAAQHNVTV
jgi:hypothetical protein